MARSPNSHFGKQQKGGTNTNTNELTVMTLRLPGERINAVQRADEPRKLRQ